VTHIRGNFLLNRLPRDVLSSIEPCLATVELPPGEVLAETHQPIEKVYFPLSGIISCMVELVDGGAIETGMIGRDGVFGATQALDGRVSVSHVKMQVRGRMSVVSSRHFRQLADQLPPLRKLMFDYEQFLFAQAQQTAACNAVHDIQARACKWLLRMHDLVGADLALTQEFLAQMMGVRRTSITAVACALQEEGMISYRRGYIHLLDLARLRKCACECHEAVRSNYSQFFGHNIEKAWPDARRVPYA